MTTSFPRGVCARTRGGATKHDTNKRATKNGLNARLNIILTLPGRKTFEAGGATVNYTRAGGLVCKRTT
jgi:hypothetical protein